MLIFDLNATDDLRRPAASRYAARSLLRDMKTVPLSTPFHVDVIRCKMTEIYVPAVVGHDVLALVDRVEWDGLQHAFASPEHVAGTRRRGTSLDYHPKRALEKLGAPDEDAFRMAIAALYQSLCHQGGTIYEATPYAVPFLAAFVAGADTPPARARAAGELVACMGMASCFVSERGTSLGAYGPGVGPRTRDSLRASRVHLAAAQARHRALRKVFELLDRVLADEPPNPAAVKRLEAYFS